MRSSAAPTHPDSKLARTIRIATWNIDHRAGYSRDQPAMELVGAIRELAADIVVLTEYVPRRSVGLRDLLQRELYQYTEVSCEDIGTHNYVLIAATTPLVKSLEFRPRVDTNATTNLLHVNLPRAGIDIVGLRVPAYTSQSRHLRTMYWGWLARTAGTLRERPAVITGDLNVDPEGRSPKAYRDHMRRLDEQWQRAVPEPRGSFWSVGKSGRRAVQIDHTLVSPHFRLVSARNVIRTPSHVLIDTEHPSSRKTALSDHAALVVDIERGS